MGNTESSIGLSEEDMAILQRDSEKNARIVKDIEEQELRKKTEAENAAAAQAAAEKARREEAFIADQLAAKERVDQEAKKTAEDQAAARRAARQAKAKAASEQALAEQQAQTKAVGETAVVAKRPRGRPPKQRILPVFEVDDGDTIVVSPNRRDSKQPSDKSLSSENKAQATPSKPSESNAQPPTALPPRPTSSHKRSAPSGGFDLSSLPVIQKRSKQAVSSPTSPQGRDEDIQYFDDLGEVCDINGERQAPNWYRQLKQSNRRDPKHGDVDVLLQRLKENINKVKNMAPTAAQAIREKAVNEVRTAIHKVFFIEVTAQLLRDRRLLDNKAGLPQIFDSRYDENVAWPYDVKADAEELYNKWCARTFEVNLMRGIRVGQPKTPKDPGSSDSIDPSFPKVPANYFGNGRLLNGQWWPTQLTALRDGAHGSSQGGIYGEVGKGAYSVIMSGGVDKSGVKYPDVDNGDNVLYCGTDNDGPEKKPSAYTQRLIESYMRRQAQEDQPVRLIRSSNADPAYAPQFGFRYDGLYDVVGMERMDAQDSKRQRHRFTLKRCAGQDPIRGGSNAQQRPTQEEVEAYKKDRALRGYSV